MAKWSDQLALFKRAKDLHGRIDHVFANAGVSVRANYLATDLDENGDLKEPSFESLDINLKGVINTATLAVYYMRPEQQSGGGSIVITSSIASFQRFRAPTMVGGRSASPKPCLHGYIQIYVANERVLSSYVAAGKHGNLGFMRALRQLLIADNLPI